MFDFLEIIAEKKILEAMREGVFDHLPGKGKPLRLDDLSHVPPELRASYMVLKNAGVLPEELQVKKEVITLQKLLDCCQDEAERVSLRKRLNEKTLRFNMLMDKRNPGRSVLRQYEEKIYARFQ